jgi:hypothetical protein
MNPSSLGLVFDRPHSVNEAAGTCVVDRLWAHGTLIGLVAGDRAAVVIKPVSAGSLCKTGIKAQESERLLSGIVIRRSPIKAPDWAKEQLSCSDLTGLRV